MIGGAVIGVVTEATIAGVTAAQSGADTIDIARSVALGLFSGAFKGAVVGGIVGIGAGLIGTGAIAIGGGFAALSGGGLVSTGMVLAGTVAVAIGETVVIEGIKAGNVLFSGILIIISRRQEPLTVKQE